MSLEASTAISFSLTSGSATGIDYGSTFQTGYEVGTSGTVSGGAVTVNAQFGKITSSTADLAAGASETITLTNSRAKASGIHFLPSYFTFFRLVLTRETYFFNLTP